MEYLTNTAIALIAGYFGHRLATIRDKKKNREELNRKILNEMFMLRFEFDTFRDYYKQTDKHGQEIFVELSRFRERINLRKLTISDLLRLHDDRKEIKETLNILFKETKLDIDERIKEIHNLVNNFAEKVNKTHIKIWKDIIKYNDENYEFDIDGFRRIP